MQEKSQDILLIVIIVLLIVLGVSTLVLQRTIDSLKAMVMPIANNQTASNTGAVTTQAEKNLPDYMVEAIKSDLATNTKDISGKIKSVSDKSITIEAEMVDVEKISQAQSADFKDLPKITKTLEVAIDKNTEFLSKKINDIKVGDTAKIYLKSSPYSKDALIAMQVVSPIAESGATGIKFIGGKVAKIGSDTITINSADENNPRTYTVKITNKTKIVKKEVAPAKETGISFSDIKTGDSVTAFSADVIGDKTSFEASLLQLLVSPS